MQSDLAQALAALKTIDTVLTKRLDAMADAMQGWPASGGNTTTRGGGVHWCWTHEREVDACHRDNKPCDGDLVDTSSDPTGEAATKRDRAADDREYVAEVAARIYRDCRTLEGILNRYASRSATPTERQETLSVMERRERAEDCWSCARTTDASGNPRFSAGERRVVIDGDKRTLCRWCLDWLRAKGQLPTLKQVDEHGRGLRVRKSA